MVFAIHDAELSFEETLAGAKADMEAATDAAEAALEAFIQERLADWQVKHDWELDQAKWQKDSYWRYHLIKLLEQKQAAVTEAVNQARSDFAAAMVAEEDESTATRGDQRQALADFSTATHQALVDAVAEDRENLGAEIDERDSTLTAFLDEQLATIRADVQAEVDSFVDSMKTLYNYADIPQYNVEENLQIVPYTEYQHRNFLHKFGFWLDGQLSGLDARIEQMVIDTTAQVASITDAADVQGGHLETDNVVQREISEDFLANRAAELLDNYQVTQDLELEVLKDTRDAAEQLALVKAEEFKKQIIYAAHVLRYANSYGYNHFVPKGPNGLTGVDELDRLTYGDLEPAGLLYGHGYGYAQTMSDPDLLHEEVITENEVDDHHHDKLEQMLADARQGFADMIQACRDDFQAMVDTDKQESDDRKAEVDEILGNAVDAAAQDQLNLGNDTVNTLTEENLTRNLQFFLDTESVLNEFNSDVDDTIEKVNTWFNERIATVETTIDDEYAVHHIVHELEEVRDAAVAELEDRKVSAQEVMDSMRDALLANTDAILADLVDVVAAEQATLSASSLAL
jgi:hypothetical protein